MIVHVRYLLVFCSNSGVPQDVLQSLKKQCNPTLKKSFKERNPDVDMDEIQNNPNVPEDVKAAITGAMSLTLEEDEADEAETCDESLPHADVEPFDDDYIMMSDDDAKQNGRRRGHENDEDWLTGRRKGARPRKAKRKHKKRSKVRSENGENARQTDDTKVKKKRSKKLTDNTNDTLNSALNSTVENGNSLLGSTLNGTLNSTLGSSTFNSTNTTITSSSGIEHSNGSFNLTNGSNGSIEIKQKKAPKKRDITEKPVNGIVRKTSRRQFSSISAIMECIEAVVKGKDTSIGDSDMPSDAAVKTEKFESIDDSYNVPPPHPTNNLDRIKIEPDETKIKSEPKKKPRRKSTVAKSKEPTPMALKPNDELPSANQLTKSRKNGSTPKSGAKKPPANGTPTKQPKTSMKTKNSFAK